MSSDQHLFPQLYPWQQSQWDEICQKRVVARLPHAMLLHGMSGLGKFVFSQVVAASLLCQRPDAQGFACQQCGSCHLFVQKSHPALQIVEPAQSGQVIKVEQIRALHRFASHAAHQDTYRVVIIANAEVMNIAAGNAFLKLLEEPGPGMILLLVATVPSQLPATIRSRCHCLSFFPVAADKIKAWLQNEQHGTENLDVLAAISQGAPLRAQALMAHNLQEQRQNIIQALLALTENRLDPLAVANDYSASDVEMVLDCFVSWVMDIIKACHHVKYSQWINVDYVEAIHGLSQRQRSTQGLFVFLAQLMVARQSLTQKVPLNSALLLDDLFSRWYQLWFSN